MSSGARRGTMIAGAAMSATSILLIRSGANDSDHDGVNENFLNDDWGAYYLGSALFLAGITTLLVGVASREETLEASVTYHPSAAQIDTQTYVPAPTFDPVPEDAPPAQTVELHRRPIAALPEMAATDDVVRLAKQVRSAATFSRCEAAWIMWIDLQKLDAGYARALRDGPVMARCAH
jgi:hypothetical protein